MSLLSFWRFPFVLRAADATLCDRISSLVTCLARRSFYTRVDASVIHPGVMPFGFRMTAEGYGVSLCGAETSLKEKVSVFRYVTQWWHAVSV